MELPDTRYVTRRDGISIAYQVVGDGPVDLLYAPGFISHLDLNWTEPGFVRFARALTSFTRLICYDKPGTGLSDPIPHVPTVDERMEDIRTVLDAAGSSQAVLMGFSEGGPACILFSATWPDRVRGLVLYGSFPRVSLPTEDEFTTRYGLPAADYAAAAAEATAKRLIIDDLLDHWGEGRITDVFAPTLTNQLQRRVWAVYERSAASPAMARAVIDAANQIDVSDVLPLIKVPTLVVHRTGDFISVMLGRFLGREIPGAKYVEFPGDDHAFWIGDSEPFVAEIQQFVTGARSPGEAERTLTTVLFTDIVGSTQRAAELGDAAWRALLEQHDRVLTDQVSRHGGRVVKSLGDGALAVFDGPARAIRCAEALIGGLRPLGLNIRAGIHTGECEVLGDDIGGIAVHIGARVSSLAGSDEVLVSGTVRDLVVGSSFYFEDRGEYELKGVPGRWRVSAVRDAPPPEVLTGPREHMTRGDRVVGRIARRAPGVLRAAYRLTAMAQKSGRDPTTLVSSGS